MNIYIYIFANPINGIVWYHSGIYHGIARNGDCHKWEVSKNVWLIPEDHIKMYLLGVPLFQETTNGKMMGMQQGTNNLGVFCELTAVYVILVIEYV